jgi:hypothetical protein
MEAFGQDVRAETKFLPVVTQFTDSYGRTVAMVTTEMLSTKELNHHTKRLVVKDIKTYKNIHCHVLNNALGSEQFAAK